METEGLLSTNSAGSNQRRRPYHYTANYWDAIPTLANSDHSSTGSASDLVGINEGDDEWSMRANYSRYLYYNRLRRVAVPDEDDILLIPPHVIPTEFLYGYPNQFVKGSDGKQSSMVTVFAVWNTMMGTSLLSMPWALERAGVIPGITLLVLVALLSFYTAFRILQVFEAHENSVVTDFAVLCKRLLGKWAQWVALIFSVLTLIGACIVYWVLMSNFLYHTVDFLHAKFIIGPIPNETFYNSTIFCPSMENETSTNDTGPDPNDEFHQIWDLHRTVPLFLITILGPLACIRSPTFFTKFNSMGTFSVLYLIIFCLVKGASYGVNVSFTDDTSPSYIPLYKSTFPALAGMLSLAFFIHNCLITIMKNNRYPENNKRDLSFAFILVVITYLFIGGTIYLIFPLEKMCIEDNFLNNFRSQDLWAFTARIFLFFQMITVFPLLSYILRVQVFYSITKREPTLMQVILLSTFVIAICVCFGIWLPKIGTIIRFTGAICGLVYLFFLPICLYLKWQKNIGHLTPLSAFFHVTLLGLGLVNFVAQFAVHVE